MEDYWDLLHKEHCGKFSAVGYSGLGEGFNRESYIRLRIPALKRILSRNGIKPNAILEAGVGIGAYANIWRQLGSKKWVGVDISPRAIDDLSVRFPQAHFYVMNIARSNDDPLVGRQFELVTAIDVLYHIVEDKQFKAGLIWLGSKVQNGGYLLISDVFTDSPYGRRFSHVRRRPLRDYIGVLKPVGFELCDREPVFSILGDPVPDGSGRGKALFLIWRVLQKSIRMIPEGLRNTYGATVVKVLHPIDRLMREIIDVRGINLELVLFVRGAS